MKATTFEMHGEYEYFLLHIWVIQARIIPAFTMREITMKSSNQQAFIENFSRLSKALLKSRLL